MKDIKFKYEDIKTLATNVAKWVLEHKDSSEIRALIESMDTFPKPFMKILGLYSEFRFLGGFLYPYDTYLVSEKLLRKYFIIQSKLQFLVTDWEGAKIAEVTDEEESVDLSEIKADKKAFLDAYVEKQKRKEEENHKTEDDALEGLNTIVPVNENINPVVKELKGQEIEDELNDFKNNLFLRRQTEILNNCIKGLKETYNDPFLFIESLKREILIEEEAEMFEEFLKYNGEQFKTFIRAFLWEMTNALPEAEKQQELQQAKELADAAEAAEQAKANTQLRQLIESIKLMWLVDFIKKCYAKFTHLKESINDNIQENYVQNLKQKEIDVRKSNADINRFEAHATVHYTLASTKTDVKHVKPDKAVEAMRKIKNDPDNRSNFKRMV